LISENFSHESLSKEGTIFFGTMSKKKATHTFSQCFVKVDGKEALFVTKDQKVIHRVPLNGFRVQR
jgi:hypothetical protein